MAGVTAPETVVGTPCGKIPVDISYRIIELFSAGLYSSPHKAVEELVCNSYDAMATRVDILVPTPVIPSQPKTSIWVVDDGTSMDMEGLNQLWRIATSEKRKASDKDEQGSQTPRLQIGKFGIGKLATYVLATQVTYICRTYQEQELRVLAVTMDYGSLDREVETGIRTERRELEVRELNEEALSQALEPLRHLPSGQKLAAKLIDPSSGCWTAAAMSGLREKAEQIKQGRLAWLLSTALPNSPQFALYLNGTAIESQKASREPLDSWELGSREIVAKGIETSVDSDGQPCVLVEGIAGVVKGVAEIYSDVLDTGTSKSELIGRSHGFFVMVRERLVNLDDPLFGRDPLSHQSFNRFRMIVNVDGLDSFLTSGRESIMDVPAVQTLRDYLRIEFNRARQIYEQWQRDETEAARLSRKISRSGGALTRRPLAGAVQRRLRGGVEKLTLIDTPSDLDEEARDSFIRQIEEDSVSDDGLIRAVQAEPTGVDRFIGRYDPVTRTVYVNILHPFYGNYIEQIRSKELFDSIAVAEVLLEAYLIEEGLTAEVAYRILARRDELLRELVAADRRSAVIIARNLLDQSDNEKGLEEASKEAFQSLGFDVTPIGGSGTPDGLAKAVLGYRRDTGNRADYSFTYDAKSTGGKKIKADKVGVSRIARHRSNYGAQFSVVIAPDFEGATDPESAISQEVAGDGQTILIRVPDLALLVTVAARRQLGFTRLRQLFERAHMPDEVRNWIDDVWTSPEPVRPIRDILQALRDLQEAYPDPVTIPALNIFLQQTRSISLREQELREYLAAMAAQAPALLDLAANDVLLNCSPERLMGELARQTAELDDALAALYSSIEDPPGTS